MSTSMNLASAFFHQARLHPGRPAVVSDVDGAIVQTTFAELADAVVAATDWLTANGVASQEFVACSLKDGVADLVHFIALTGMGVGFYPLASGSDVERGVIRRLGISKLVTDHDGLAGMGLEQLAVDGPGARAASTGQWRTAQLPDCAERPWLVRSSSGTTGHPKIFVTTHAVGASRRDRYFSAVGAAGAGFYSFTPIRFGASRQRYFYELCRGNTTYLLGESDALAVKIGKINHHRISGLYCVPMYLELLGDMATGREGGEPVFPHLPLIESTSSTVDPALRQRMEAAVSPHFVNCYAVSEVGHISSSLGLGPAKEAGSDIGAALDGIEFGVFDDAGAPVARGEVGHVAVRIDSNRSPIRYLEESGQWVSPERDGWFFTGDLAKVSAEDRITFMGRSDDLIIFNGINIFPEEIERAARAVPGVRDACAFGVPSRLHHQVPCVAVVATPAFDGREFMRSLRGRLDARAPARMVVLEGFPRNAMGKVLRRELAEMMLARKPEGGMSTPGGGAEVGAASAALRRAMRRFSLEIVLPAAIDPSTHLRWSPYLVGADGWLAADEVPAILDRLGEAEKLHLVSFLALSKAFFRLVKIPVFSVPTLVSVAPVAGEPGKRRLEIDVPVVEFISESSSRSVLAAALDVCGWIAANPPTPENRERLLATLQERVLKGLGKGVPAGKSMMPVLAVAHALDIPFTHLGLGVYQLGWGSKARRLDGSRSGQDSAIGSRLSQNKAATTALLKLAGLPAPVHGIVANAQQASALAARLGWPVVVKPLDMDRGEGVVVDVADEKTLAEAFLAASNAAKSRPVLVERQVTGTCHRLFMACGRMLYAVKRLPMSVRGDGVRTVHQLVADELHRQEALPPWERSGIRPLDALALEALRRAGLSPESVPAVGVLAPLRRIESTEWGGIDEEVTAIVHPDNLAAALAATDLLGLEIAGVDIISPDISKSWRENGAVINEVNYSPLLGGGEISRSHIAEFLGFFIDGDGRIPVEFFPGRADAEQRHKELLARGVRCFYASPAMTVDPGGREIATMLHGTVQHVRALLLRQDVDAVVAYAPD